jgi:chemotaxis protein methyltransferase CheR
MEKMMTDSECVDFLQRALPQLGLRWPGFRKVRGQVHKRLNRRLGELRLAGITDYRHYLQAHPDEWPGLDELCRISISRFYRDRIVFDCLRDEVLPTLAEAAIARGENLARCWSAGCASGEEIYTIVLLWHEHLQSRFPQVQLRALATDTDDQMLRRARRAEYPASSLKDAPPGWRETAFTDADKNYILRPEYKRQVEFQKQDVRTGTPAESFHLILCRNLVLTYFAEELQQQVLGRIVGRIVPGGFLVIGKHEPLPEGVEEVAARHSDLGIYQAIASA